MGIAGEKCDLLAEKRDLFGAAQLRGRHDPDPIRIQPIAVPLTVLDNGVGRRRGGLRHSWPTLRSYPDTA